MLNYILPCFQKQKVFYHIIFHIITGIPQKTIHIFLFEGNSKMLLFCSLSQLLVFVKTGLCVIRLYHSSKSFYSQTSTVAGLQGQTIYSYYYLLHVYTYITKIALDSNTFLHKCNGLGWFNK